VYCSSKCRGAGWYRLKQGVTSDYKPIEQPEDPTLRRCPGCDRVLSLDEFHQAHTRPEGVTVYCKDCQSKRDTERYWSDPEYHKARRRRYYDENAEAMRELARQWYRENRAESIERTRRWMEDNPERWREIKRAAQVRRKARQRNATIVDFSSEALAERLSMCGGRCWMCGAEAEQVDHVKPIAKMALTPSPISDPFVHHAMRRSGITGRYHRSLSQLAGVSLAATQKADWAAAGCAADKTPRLTTSTETTEQPPPGYSEALARRPPEPRHLTLACSS
jgi:hypothetical protein